QVVSRRIVNRPDGCGRPVVVHGDVETGDKISAVAQCRGLVPLVALGYRHPAAVHIPATATAAMQRLSPVLLIEFLPCMGAQSCFHHAWVPPKVALPDEDAGQNVSVGLRQNAHLALSSRLPSDAVEVMTMERGANIPPAPRRWIGLVFAVAATALLAATFFGPWSAALIIALGDAEAVTSTFGDVTDYSVPFAIVGLLASLTAAIAAVMPRVRVLAVIALGAGVAAAVV